MAAIDFSGDTVRQIRTSLSLKPNSGTYAEQSCRHFERAAVRLSLKLVRE